MSQDAWSVGYDAAFGLNEFNQPKLVSEVELVKNVLLFILFSKPGQYPSLPMIGMDIQSKLYSFYDELDETDLKNDLTSQCAALGVYFQEGTIQFKKTKYRGKPSLLIHIEGKESYPDGYLRDTINAEDVYMIGITFDDLNRMIYNVSSTSEGSV
jgi:hypothetical protein